MIIPYLRIVAGVPPHEVAGTSLVFVLANTATSTIGYLRHKLVDLSLAWPIAIAAVPGSILGVAVVRRLAAPWFDAIYGVLLVILAVLVLRRRTGELHPPGAKTFAHRLPVAAATGFAMGLFSSVFGIGGGIVMIPVLLIAARMAPLVVTATANFGITFTAPVGVVTHALAGDVAWASAVPLVLGGLVGGLVGPPIARRISSPALITLLAGALFVAAALLVLRHLV